jgi:hypothetical protein
VAYEPPPPIEAEVSHRHKKRSRVEGVFLRYSTIRDRKIFGFISKQQIQEVPPLQQTIYFRLRNPYRLLGVNTEVPNFPIERFR